MPLCEQSVPETGARLLLLHGDDPEFKDKNGDNHVDRPPAPGQQPSQQQQRDENHAASIAVSASRPSEDTFGIHQEFDAIEQLDANGDGCDGDGLSLIPNSGDINVGQDVGRTVGRCDRGGPAAHSGHTDAHPNYIHQQRRPHYHRLAVLDEMDSAELDSTPIAPQSGDEDTTAAHPGPSASYDEKSTALRSCLSSSSSLIPSLILPSPFKLLSDGDDGVAVDDDKPDTPPPSSTVPLMPLTVVTASLSSTQSQCKTSLPRTSSHLPWRVSSPSNSSTATFSGDPLSTTDTYTGQPYTRETLGGTSATEDRNTFSATDWRQEQQQYQQQQTSSPNMEQTWPPASSATNCPSLLSTWSDMPSSPFDDHSSSSKSSFPTAPYSGAPVSLASYATSNTMAAGSPSFGATAWPSDSGAGYNQTSPYPSSPVRLDNPAALAEYARYPSHKMASPMHDSLPSQFSSSSGGFHSYPRSGYYGGPTGLCSPSYPSSMDMYQSTRTGSGSGGPFSPSASGLGPSYSHGFSTPILPSYDRMSSSVLMGGSDTFSTPTVSSNSLYVPTSMSAFLPPFNMSGNNNNTSPANYNGSKNPSTYPQDPLAHSSFQQHATVTAAMGRTMTKQEMQAMDPDPKFCHNCKTTVTPSWRRCPQGRILLCNACGLYQKLHGKARPFFKAKDGTIKIHRALPEHDPCALCKTTQTPVWRKGPDNLLICNGCSLIARHGKSLVRPLLASNDVSLDGDGGIVSSTLVRPLLSSASVSASTYRHSASTGKRSRARLGNSLARSESPFDQHHDTLSGSLSPPPPELYKPRSKSSSSSSRRSSHQRRNHRSTVRGTTTATAALAPNSVHVTALSRMSTKCRQAKKRKTSSTSSKRVHYDDTAADEPSMPISMSMADQPTSGGKSYHLSPDLAQGYEPSADNDDGYGTFGEVGGHDGGGDRGYGMSDWRQHRQHPSLSPLPFYPDDAEPFLPSPEGSRGGNNGGIGAAFERHQQQQQQQGLLPSHSYSLQSHYGHQCHQQQQEHQNHYSRQQQQYGRQPEGHRVHPTPPSDFPYSLSAARGFRSEADTEPFPTAVVSITVGSGATTKTEAPVRPASSSSTSAIPDSSFHQDESVPTGSNTDEIKREGTEVDENGDEEEEAVDGEEKATSVTNTGSDLSSAGEYDSDVASE
ncbi:hypothetical protein F5H01DRAFT_402898 [Linnemannia elongata]|nr:hypothetical protein F5H01DRAFT_402898 [Linnemannia elongata]